MSVEAISRPKTPADPRGRRLESWKEIAAYLGRDVTTVRRWERREGLPVYRILHSKLGSADHCRDQPWRRGVERAQSLGSRLEDVARHDRQRRHEREAANLPRASTEAVMTSQSRGPWARGALNSRASPRVSAISSMPAFTGRVVSSEMT